MDLTRHCVPLLLPREMTLWNRTAIKSLGMSQSFFIKNAGHKARAALLEVFGPLTSKEVLVLAGPGKNGKDAFALAQLLVRDKANVRLIHTLPLKQYHGKTLANLISIGCSNIAIEMAVSGITLPDADLVIDGLLGIGFSGTLTKTLLYLVREINRLGHRAFVFSLDIPSGLNGTTGLACPEAVQAHATVTFQAIKTGLVQPGAKVFTGTLLVKNIGIPESVQNQYPAEQWLLDRKILGLIPRPEAIMHKGTAGHVLILGGSEGLVGAPLLAALGALRAGAGLVTVACPAGLSDAVHAGFPEVMTLPLGKGRKWNPYMAHNLDLSRFNAIVLGPGMGRTIEAALLLKAVLRKRMPPLILDADGLTLLAKYPQIQALLPHNSIVTPHPGEAAKLLDQNTDQVQFNRTKAVRELASRLGCVVLLKGAGSLVATPDSRPLFLCSLVSPSLAIGGSGDVLSGVIGALLARGLPSLTTACIGMYWHAAGGVLLDARYPVRGALAREIADILPLILKKTLCS